MKAFKEMFLALKESSELKNGSSKTSMQEDSPLLRLSLELYNKTKDWERVEIKKLCEAKPYSASLWEGEENKGRLVVVCKRGVPIKYYPVKDVKNINRRVEGYIRGLNTEGGQPELEQAVGA
ncbi:MAG: hypothetical protein HZB80_01830 [Deltaproteobacteria bacterium]|nr:hypothetical protein [Deltaproteobacteria bacterium]